MEKLLKKVYDSRRAKISLTVISHAAAVISAIAFLGVLVYTFSISKTAALGLLLSAGIPFILVSVMRRLINAPRPYELYGFYAKKPKQKAGRSFPSRHVFSAFVIATLSITVSVWLAAALFVIGLCLALSRVFLGIHFIRDTVAGALIGIISGVLGIVIIL